MPCIKRPLHNFISHKSIDLWFFPGINSSLKHSIRTCYFGRSNILTSSYQTRRYDEFSFNFFQDNHLNTDKIRIFSYHFLQRSTTKYTSFKMGCEFSSSKTVQDKEGKRTTIFLSFYLLAAEIVWNVVVVRVTFFFSGW